jgi:hypothetical protein
MAEKQEMVASNVYRQEPSPRPAKARQGHAPHGGAPVLSSSKLTGQPARSPSPHQDTHNSGPPLYTTGFALAA